MLGGPKSRKRPWLMAKLMYRRVFRLGALFALAFCLVSVLVWWLEKDLPNSHIHTLFDSVWFCICTVSTVGYGDTYPVTTLGRVVTGGFILFTLTTIGFLLTAINDAVIEVKRMEEKGLLGTLMKKHIIVCGFSPVARTAIEELLAANRDVAVICDQNEDLLTVQRYGPRSNLFTTTGDLEQDVFRDRLNAKDATTAVIATEEDTQNIIAALNLRAVNPDIRIVVAVKTEALRQTLIASGVTYVSSPFELSGRLVASAAFEPEVARFVDDITSSVDGFDLQQYSAEPFDGMTVKEVREKLIDLSGPLLVALAQWNGQSYEITPHPKQSQTISAKDFLIVVANEDHADQMSTTFKVRQGR